MSPVDFKYLLTLFGVAQLQDIAHYHDRSNVKAHTLSNPRQNIRSIFSLIFFQQTDSRALASLVGFES